MHIITVCYYSGQSQDFLYTDDDAEIAVENFKKLQTAMAQYQRFKNDNSETITLFSSTGESVYRIEHLVSVSISNAEQTEPLQKQWVEWQGRLIKSRTIAATPSPQESTDA